MQHVFAASEQMTITEAGGFELVGLGKRGGVGGEGGGGP